MRGRFRMSRLFDGLLLGASRVHGEKIKRACRIAQAEEHALHADISLLFDLLYKPTLILSHRFKIISYDMPVHYDGGKQQLLRDEDMHVLGRGGAIARAGQEADSAVVFEHGGLDLREVAVSRETGERQKVVDIQLCFFEIVAVYLSAIE